MSLKVNEKDRIGKQFLTQQGYTITVIEYRTARDCSVSFEDGTKIKNIYYANVKKGKINYSFRKSVHSTGFLGVGDYKIRNESKNLSVCYFKWFSCLARCYSKNQIKKYPTYKGCSVNELWHNFQNFAKWFEENYNSETMQDWELDKDILLKGNKVYSPETCCFVPREVNNLFNKHFKKRGLYPLGVVSKFGKFQARLNIEGSETYLGLHETPEEAFQAYKTAKENYIKEVAEKWKNKIADNVYQALINYKVEITD